MPFRKGMNLHQPVMKAHSDLVGRVLASALNGGPSRLYASRVQVTGAIDALVKTAKKSGDMRQDLERADWRLQRVSWRYRAVRRR